MLHIPLANMCQKHYFFFVMSLRIFKHAIFLSFYLNVYSYNLKGITVKNLRIPINYYNANRTGFCNTSISDQVRPLVYLLPCKMSVVKRLMHLEVPSLSLKLLRN